MCSRPRACACAWRTRRASRAETLDAARHGLALHQWMVAPDFEEEGEVRRPNATSVISPATAAAAARPLLVCRTSIAPARPDQGPGELSTQSWRRLPRPTGCTCGFSPGGRRKTSRLAQAPLRFAAMICSASVMSSSRLCQPSRPASALASPRRSHEGRMPGFRALQQAHPRGHDLGHVAVAPSGDSLTCKMLQAGREGHGCHARNTEEEDTRRKVVSRPASSAP
jgi:hypothetical protein